MRARFSTDRPVNATPSLAVRRIIPYPRSSAIRGDARHRATLDGAVRRIALTLCDLRVLAEESPIEEAGRLVERVRCLPVPGSHLPTSTLDSDSGRCTHCAVMPRGVPCSPRYR